jgi:hypothetical protein
LKHTIITELLGTNPCFQEELLYMPIKGDRMSYAGSMHMNILKYFLEDLKRRVFGRSAHKYNIKIVLKELEGEM